MNLEVKDVKGKATGGNLVVAEKDLSLLKNTKKRHEPEVDKVCGEFEALQRRKEQLDLKPA